MKFKLLLPGIGMLALVVTACMPNRLTKSLPTSPTEQSQGTATISAEVDLPATDTPDAEIHFAPEAAPTPSGRSLQPQLAPVQIDPDDVVALLPPDAIRAIDPGEVAQIMVSAADADTAGMSPDARVLGVSINGESRAYPIPYMSSHEIVNDEVGGKLIAATW